MQKPCPHPKPQEKEQEHTCARQLYVEQPDPTASALLHESGQVIGILLVKPGNCKGKRRLRVLGFI